MLTPPDSQGHVMSVKCEEPIDELTVQVWLMYDQWNLIYSTSCVSGMELRTDRLKDIVKGTDIVSNWLQDAPHPHGPFKYKTHI